MTTIKGTLAVLGFFAGFIGLLICAPALYWDGPTGGHIAVSVSVLVGWVSVRYLNNSMKG